MMLLYNEYSGRTHKHKYNTHLDLPVTTQSYLLIVVECAVPSWKRERKKLCCLAENVRSIWYLSISGLWILAEYMCVCVCQWKAYCQASKLCRRKIPFSNFSRVKQKITVFSQCYWIHSESYFDSESK